MRFERILDHDIQTVWNAITRPEELKYWFTDFEMDIRQGGKITIQFRDEAKTISSAVIIALEPPHRFVYEWEGELAEWLLESIEDNKCKLILQYSRLQPDSTTSVSAGFHTLLDRLHERLSGSNKTFAFGTEKNDPALLKEYEDEVYGRFPELKPLVMERTYNATVDKVWKAITDKDEMKMWYFNLSAFKPEVGFEFEFAGQGRKGENYIHHCKIIEVIPEKKLTYSWKYKDYEGMSHVTFELFSEGNKTRLKLTHTGLHTFPQDNADFGVESFTGGWTELIGNLLKKHVEAS